MTGPHRGESDRRSDARQCRSTYGVITEWRSIEHASQYDDMPTIASKNPVNQFFCKNNNRQHGKNAILWMAMLFGKQNARICETDTGIRLTALSVQR